MANVRVGGEVFLAKELSDREYYRSGDIVQDDNQDVYRANVEVGFLENENIELSKWSLLGSTKTEVAPTPNDVLIEGTIFHVVYQESSGQTQFHEGWFVRKSDGGIALHNDNNVANIQYFRASPQRVEREEYYKIGQLHSLAGPARRIYTDDAAPTITPSFFIDGLLIQNFLDWAKRQGTPTGFSGTSNLASYVLLDNGISKIGGIGFSIHGGASNVAGFGYWLNNKLHNPEGPAAEYGQNSTSQVDPIPSQINAFGWYLNGTLYGNSNRGSGIKSQSNGGFTAWVAAGGNPNGWPVVDR